MLKLIIADDERVIRETISSLIDWKDLGIELIGLCKDGIEAYNMILDENPDIVMTDIRMPGLSGIDLVRESVQTSQKIQFIILSGYDEFEYARELMKYGVKHYLLKPCNEKNIIESVRSAIEDCNKIRGQDEERKRKNELLRLVRQDAMYHIFIDSLSMTEMDDSQLLKRLKTQIDFYSQTYELDQGRCYLYYIFYLEPKYLEKNLGKIKLYAKQTGLTALFYGIYVSNVLLLFSYEEINMDDLEITCREVSSLIKVSCETYADLFELLECVFIKVRRFDVVYAIHDFKPVLMINDQNMIRHMQKISHNLGNKDEKIVQYSLDELITMTKEASKAEFFQMLGNHICFQLFSMGVYSISEVNHFFQIAQQERDVEMLRILTFEMLEKAKQELSGSQENFGLIPERVMAYVDEHLQDSDLTLKKVAEEHLFMNVDYVSRQFKKATNKKFSQYLTEQRVKRAKQIMSSETDSKIQYVAERVGCGNNPQYFSQIFKKTEGMTPAKYLEQIRLTSR